MAILDSKNDQQAPSIFKIASGVEMATMHLQTLLDGICQAVEDEDEAMPLTLVESARHFVIDIEQLRQTLSLHARTERDTFVDVSGAPRTGAAVSQSVIAEPVV